MPDLIPLEKLPNQSLQVILEGNRYDLTFKKCVEIMCVDISRNNEVILQGSRCVAKQPLIPYRYLEGAMGNFMFVTDNDEFPSYELFGVNQFLFFYSNAELVALRGES